jgi:hypothetical protein
MRTLQKSLVEANLSETTHCPTSLLDLELFSLHVETVPDIQVHMYRP